MTNTGVLYRTPLALVPQAKALYEVESERYAFLQCPQGPGMTVQAIFLGSLNEDSGIFSDQPHQPQQPRDHFLHSTFTSTSASTFDYSTELPTYKN